MELPHGQVGLTEGDPDLGRRVPENRKEENGVGGTVERAQGDLVVGLAKLFF